MSKGSNSIVSTVVANLQKLPMLRNRKICIIFKQTTILTIKFSF